jgi:hypothetical protein
MSKHVGRKHRWARVDAKSYSSETGRVVYERGAWYAVLAYRTPAPAEPSGGLANWLSHGRRVGPFKRPRNAMVALEQEATILKNHYGEDVRFGGEAF